MVEWIGDGDMPKHIGGWQTGEKSYHIIFRNKTRSDIIHLKYNASQAQRILSKYHNLFYPDKR